MIKKQMNIEVGKKYKGYGFLNEFGEWQFVPEQVGAHAGRKRLLVSYENMSVFLTDKKMCINLSIKRASTLAMIVELGTKCNKLIEVIKSYEI